MKRYIISKEFYVVFSVNFHAYFFFKSREEEQDPRLKKLLLNRILTEAFVELLEWDDYYGWPETLAMDAHR